VPMKGAGGECIGALVLLRKKSGSFSQDQLSMSQLLAVRAATAIENARLYQRTREDAEAKTTLLRELNHRVKNNLAGIVALLSIDQPELSPRARQWLNRVTDRVRTLSRTQEMLTAGFGPVTLRELIDHTLRSLSVVVRPDVTVGVEVKETEVRLRNDRAVSVAMVLHELCYNALVHGLSESGTLWVKASTRAVADRASEPGDLVLEVIDDGCGFHCVWDEGKSWNGQWRPKGEAESSDPVSAVAVVKQAPSGSGLNLVRDFVGRELHGKFSVTSTPGHGTTARVEFALLPSEWDGRAS
jgi:two-component sensor histidine kinase